MTLFQKISILLLLSIGVLFVIELHWPWMLIPIGLWLILTIIGSFHIRWNYFLKATHRLTSTENEQIALTFDDGPHPEITPQILKLLQQYNMKATFFCIGKQIKKHPEIIKQLHEAGHAIGNHSTSHSTQFGFFSSQKVIEEIKQCDDLIRNTIAIESRYFRPPFGVTNPAIATALKKSTHQVIGWSVRSYDTLVRSPEQIQQRVCKSLQAGDVVLLHDTNQRTVDALKLILPALQERQLNSVSIETLLTSN